MAEYFTKLIAHSRLLHKVVEVLRHIMRHAPRHEAAGASDHLNLMYKSCLE